MREAVVGRRGEALREICGVKENLQRHEESFSRAMEIFEARNVFSPMWMRPMGSAEEVRERLLWAASLTCILKLCLGSPKAHWPAACMSQAFPFLARKIISRHDQSWLSFRPLHLNHQKFILFVARWCTQVF